MMTLDILQSYAGQTIADICPHGFDDSDDNHCAHFVAHVLQLHFGMTCGRLKGMRDAPAAANVRVQEIFAECPETREVVSCPAVGEGLIFVSHRTSFRGTPTRIRNVPRKHIAIQLNGLVWHYSNTRDRVVSQSVGSFLEHYPRQQNALWWGAFPRVARVAAFATSSV